jgi:hypothetical protein
MTNRAIADAPVIDAPAGVTFDLSTLTFGDLRRLSTMNAETAQGMDVIADVLERAVVGGLDAIPLRETMATVKALMAQVTAEMSGKNE